MLQKWSFEQHVELWNSICAERGVHGAGHVAESGCIFMSPRRLFPNSSATHPLPIDRLTMARSKSSCENSLKESCVREDRVVSFRAMSVSWHSLN